MKVLQEIAESLARRGKLSPLSLTHIRALKKQGILTFDQVVNFHQHSSTSNGEILSKAYEVVHQCLTMKQVLCDSEMSPEEIKYLQWLIQEVKNSEDGKVPW